MLQQHIMAAGPVVYPLLFCSVLGLALILERLLVHAVYPPLKANLRRRQFISESVKSTPGARGLLAGLQLLSANRRRPKTFRDELLSSWLQGEKRKLLAHTRWLTVLGTLAPLLGLLGTVLGIITMFQSVAHEVGPVTPALLAEGMWEAMVTTALGMLIAIPALVAAQGFSIWGESRVAGMELVLNDCSLYLEQQLLDGKHQSGASPEAQKIIKPAVFETRMEEQSA